MALIIALSLFGFSGFLALDLPLLRKQHLLRNLLSIAACLALVTGLWITPPSLAILPSAWHTYGSFAGSALIAIAVVLLAYSIFIEIPLQLRASRARQPAPSEPDAHNQVQLVVKGTYALCRHPGYLWLSILLVGYIFIEDNLNAILIATMWSILNLLLVTVQDRFIFPNTFKDYVTYQKKTPFLIPTSSSIIKAFEGPEA